MSADARDGANHDDVERLRQEVRELRDRVADLEAQVDQSSSTTSMERSTLPPAAKDYRDARVLEAFSPGTEVNVNQLQALYRQRTDIRESDTLRKRIKRLVTGEAFETIDRGRWRYRGPGGDDAQ